MFSYPGTQGPKGACQMDFAEMNSAFFIFHSHFFKCFEFSRLLGKNLVKMMKFILYDLC